MVRLGASIGIFFLGGGPACVYLHDGKILFISSGCSYHVYSIKHILNMHLIFISIRIWGLIPFMTIDSFQAICILFCSLLFISSVFSEEFKYPPLMIAPKWWITPCPSKTNTTSPMLILCTFCVFMGLPVLCSGAFCWFGSRRCSAWWTPFTAWQAVEFYSTKEYFTPALLGNISLPCQGTGWPGAENMTAESQTPPLFRKSLPPFVPDSRTRTRNTSLPNPLPPQGLPPAWHFTVSED